MLPQSSEYVLSERREHSLYVIQNRAIPSICDGLKNAARRVLYMARNGDKYKTAVLSGNSLILHPHSVPDGAINTLTAPFSNNIPLFTGIGAFGTLLNPNEYGASRYTSVKLSKFSHDVLMVDSDIVPMIDNYDSTIKEPEHFLPLIPICLLNQTQGIAVGFATNILPRLLDDIINAQLLHLQGKDFKEIEPKFKPLESYCISKEKTETGYSYTFEGEFKRIDSSNLKITKLPYGLLHEKVIKKIDNEIDKNGNVLDYTDSSSNTIDIVIKFKKGTLSNITDESIKKMFGLVITHNENLNVLDISGKKVLNTTSSNIIKIFTDWRLSYFPIRYQRLLDLLNIDISKYNDLILCCEKDLPKFLVKIESKSELCELLEDFGVVNIDYISTLPVYRFTTNECNKIRNQLKEALVLKSKYELIISNVNEQIKIYTSELKQILTNYNKGKYN